MIVKFLVCMCVCVRVDISMPTNNHQQLVLGTLACTEMKLCKRFPWQPCIKMSGDKCIIKNAMDFEEEGYRDFIKRKGDKIRMEHKL